MFEFYSRAERADHVLACDRQLKSLWMQVCRARGEISDLLHAPTWHDLSCAVSEKMQDPDSQGDQDWTQKIEAVRARCEALADLSTVHTFEPDEHSVTADRLYVSIIRMKLGPGLMPVIGMPDHPGLWMNKDQIPAIIPHDPRMVQELIDEKHTYGKKSHNPFTPLVDWYVQNHSTQKGLLTRRTARIPALLLHPDGTGKSRIRAGLARRKGPASLATIPTELLGAIRGEISGDPLTGKIMLALMSYGNFDLLRSGRPFLLPSITGKQVYQDATGSRKRYRLDAQGNTVFKTLHHMQKKPAVIQYFSEALREKGTLAPVVIDKIWIREEDSDLTFAARLQYPPSNHYARLDMEMMRFAASDALYVWRLAYQLQAHFISTLLPPKNKKAKGLHLAVAPEQYRAYTPDEIRRMAFPNVDESELTSDTWRRYRTRAMDAIVRLHKAGYVIYLV